MTKVIGVASGTSITMDGKGNIIAGSYDRTEVEDAISDAKIDIIKLRATTFLASLACSLETIITEDIPTAATNGKYIKYNPYFFMSLPRKQRAFLLAHETLHVAYYHMTRRGSRSPKKWNFAGDYIINLDLVDQGFEMIPGGLLDPKFKGMSTEEIYDIIPDPEDDDSNGIGDDIEESEGSEGDIANTEAEVRDMITRAVQLADMKDDRDSVPDSIRRALADYAKPVINWRTVLARFMQQLDKSDYSWSRPNKRHRDIYLPHMKGNALSKLTFAIDTSGSISVKQFNQFISEVAAVFRTARPRELELLQFDHALQAVDKIKNVQGLSKVHFKGHGGTEPEVALQHFIKSKSQAFICITDGYFSTNQLTKPREPVVWVVFDNPNFTCHFGKVIHFQLREK